MSPKEPSTSKPASPKIPDFQASLMAIPDPVQSAFKTVLQGEFQGIWPISPKALTKPNSTF